MATLYLNVDPQGVETGSRRAEGALDRVKGAGRQAEQQFDKTGRAAGIAAGKVKLFAVAATAAASAFAVQSIGAFRQFDKALAEVETLLDGTEAEMDALDGAAKRLAGTFGGTATQQVNAFYQAISAGVGDATDAIEFMDSANVLARAGVTDITTSVELLTSALNTYGDAGLTAAEASNTLFHGVKAGKTTITELSAALGRVLPVARSAGVSFDEVVAATASLTTGGLSTAEAVTSLRSALSQVIKPTSEAAKLAESLGIEFSVAGLEAKGFSGFMEDVIAKTNGSTEALAQLFSSQEAIVGVLALASGAGETYTETLANMAEEMGLVEEAADKVAKSLNERLNVALGKIGAAGLELGETLLTVGVPAVEALAFALGAVASNVDFFAIALGTLAATQIPAMVGGLGSMIGYLATAEGLFIAGAVAAKGMALAMNTIPLVAVATALTGIVRGFRESEEAAKNYASALGLLAKAQEDLNAAVEKFSQARTKENLDSLRGTIEDQISATKDAIEAAQREIDAAGFNTRFFGVELFETDRMAEARSELERLGGVLATLESMMSAYDVAASGAAETTKVFSQAHISEANEILATLQQEAAMLQVIAQYGENSVEVARARVNAEREAFNELLASYDVSEDLKDELRAAWEAANGLASVNLAGGIGTAADEAARLAKNLRLSKMEASLEPTGAEDYDPSGGRAAYVSSRQSGAALQSFLNEVAASGTKISGGGGGGTSAVEKLRQEYDSLMSTLDDSYAAQMRFEKGQETLNKALAAGAINSTEHATALELLKQQFEETGMAAATLQSAADTIQSGFEDAFMSIFDGTKSASEAFKDMARAVIAELFRILVVQQLVGSFDAATGSGSGLVGMFMGAVSGARAYGGPVKAGMAYDVGEQGRERFIAPADGMIIPNNQMNAAPQINVTQNLSFAEGVNAAARQEIMAAAPKLIEATKAALVDSRRRGGAMKAAF